MTNSTVIVFAIAALSALPASPAEQKVRLQDLPAAVQRAAKQQAENATLLGLSREVEKGKTYYEVELKVNGRTRDVLLNASGAVVEVEQEVSLSALPAAARAALENKAAGGTITRVESVTRGSSVTYEAGILRAGRHSEVAVAADGSPVRD